VKRKGATGSNAYGLGGLVPPAPASPAGKFLTAYGEWEAPAGGAGYTNHTDLNFRRWSISGHTDTASTLAGFASGTGAAEAVPVTTFAKTVLAGTGGPAVVNGYSQKLLRSVLPTGTSRTLTSGTAYWVYIGYTTQPITVDYVVFQVVSLGAGTQTAEVALASTPAAPNKSGQTLTKIYANGTLDSLTAINSTTKRNTVAAGQVIPEGTHLWAGLRTALVSSQPTTTAFFGASDMGHGHVLTTALSGALTGAGPWVGSLIAIGTAALGPDLGLELA
jgi:hypothetical protein